MWGLLLVIIGIIFAAFGVGGSAVLKIGNLGIVVSGGAGVILIIVGVIFLYAGI